MKTKNDEQKIRISSHGGSHNSRSITITNLPDEAYDKMMGSISGGMWWTRVVDGQLVSHPNYQQLPDPVEDEDMHPFWRKVKKQQKEITYSMFEIEPIEELSRASGSISIQSLCGYYYSEENYKQAAEQLTSYGFECLRSKRSDDAKFWEIWFLSSLYSAKGLFKNCIDAQKNDKEKFKTAVEFLKQNVPFGTLDVSVQRCFMCAPGEDDY